MTAKRRFFVPEVVQTSGMDCGPASLKCLLEGHGISVSYGRLREACQTDVDGTSIDTMEVVANQLGLVAEQKLVPIDQLLLFEAKLLPAIVVVRLPNGFTHFLVVWSRHGNFLQLMDPGSGRRVVTCKAFLDEVYKHTMAVPAAAWREFAATPDNTAPLGGRLGNLGLGKDHIKAYLDEAAADNGWLGFGCLDAATRLSQSLVDSGAFKKGAEAARLLDNLFQARKDRATLFDNIPDDYWSVRPTEDEENLYYSGAVLVSVKGTHPVDLSQQGEHELSDELKAALTEKPIQPFRLLWDILKQDGMLAPLVVAVSIIASGAAAIIETLMLRSILDLGSVLGLGWQKVVGALMLMAFFALITSLHFPTFRIIMTLGRHLEVRLRRAFLAKIPNIGDRYFQSRPRSDMADRSHRVMDVRRLPLLSNRLILAVAEMLVITGAVIYLYPAGALFTLTLCVLSLGFPLAAHPILSEVDMRVRSHLGALSKFYLDSLLGLIPLRAHVAEGAMRHQHEKLVVEWVRAKRGFIYIDAGFQAVRFLITTSLMVTLIFRYLGHGGEMVHALLLIYWVLRLPTLGHFISELVLQYPGQRNLTLRLLEPLGTPDETSVKLEDSPEPDADEPAGVHVQLEQVAVRASGHVILEEVNLNIQPGEQVAVVGPSGAGKSSLVGLMLGWYTAGSGTVTVDGRPLDGDTLEWLRARTAWVDPAVQIWNRSLLENLRYGNNKVESMSDALENADLLSLLEKMPEGMQTELGESGSMVSGGEGQRVRLGRAMLREAARFVVLDEPFRGLDRKTRGLLMKRARRLWQGATLLCVTHDISETEDFERVLVIENGRLVEDGVPKLLGQDPTSAYYRLLKAEREAMEQVWNDPSWRKLFLHKGELREESKVEP